MMSVSSTQDEIHAAIATPLAADVALESQVAQVEEDAIIDEAASD
jgi:hypothetical protein